MSRKKPDVALQTEIETQEQWDLMLSKEGLIVVDCYQTYGGPLTALVSRLRELRNLKDDRQYLHFAIANADKIPDLEGYRGRCEPCFLFYAGKELVAVVRGANAPVIIKTINEQLAQEHKVLKGEAQRKAITDPLIEKMAKQKAAKKADIQVKNIMKSTKPITICIIKPDMLTKNKKEEIVQKIKERGYEILEEKDVVFTEEMTKDFYKHLEGSEHFDELVKYMTSGKSCVLALSKEGNNEDLINSWRNDIGPTNLDEAKKNPDSFRAQYATDKLINAIHGSDTHETAMRELAFFFEEGSHDNHEKKKKLQRTIALIRPAALAAHRDAIIQKIKDNGFDIAMTKTVHLDKESAEDFYSEHRDKPYFNDLVNEMTAGPVMALCLAKEDAVSSWRNLLGPKEKEKLKEAAGTMRSEFDVATSSVNQLHGASTQEQAEKELAKFFPMEQTVAVLKPGLAPEKKAEIEKKIQDSGFIIASKKSQKLTEDLAKEMYKSHEGQPHFNDLVDLMSSGETEILILSRENAIEGWRETIGPVDPNEAKKENPNSLRALYGIDILNNGLHGPSNKEQAENEIKLFFGNVSFNERDDDENN